MLCDIEVQDTPRKVLDTKRIAALRAQGIGWKRIAAELGVGVGTIHQATQTAAPVLGGSKTQEKVFLNPCAVRCRFVRCRFRCRFVDLHHSGNLR